MRSLLSNIKRSIVMKISFTVRCSGMADIYIYIYIYTYTNAYFNIRVR